MVAEHGRESRDLEPAGHEFGARPTSEAADVRAAVGEAGQAEIDQLLDRQTQMVPRRAVVARPGYRIALPAGEGRAGHHEWAEIGPKAAHPLERPPRVLHAVDVVDLRVRRTSRSEVVALDPVQIVERHGRGRR